MITITQDAEFMTNLVSANPIPAGNRFFAFIDENLHPAVLSHSQDNKLNLVLEVDGTAQLFDFGAICGIADAVQALVLHQDADQNLWIAVATDAGNGLSNFYLIINVKPSVLLDPPSANIIKATDTFPQIHGIYMSNFTRDVGGLIFPLLFLAFQPLDRITKEDQLGYVKIAVDGSGSTSITLDRSWKLATDPLKILDVTFGECRLGKGAFVLYEVPDALKLQFRVFEGHNFSVELTAPSGARCLASYNDPATASTVFLVGGDGITQYKYADYNNPNGKGTTIVKGLDARLGIRDPSANPSIKGMHCAQSGDAITVWYSTGTDAAYYYSASTSSMDRGLLVPLLPDGAGAQISGRLTSKTDDNLKVNTLVSVDESGDLRILQQASDTGMWESHPFYIPATTNNLEIRSFTICIKAHTNANTPQENIQGCKLHLSSSGFVRVQSNGQTATLDQNGAWYQADHTGTLTIIIAASGLSCYTLQVDRFQAPGYDEVALNVPVLVPSDKANQKLASIKSGDDLLNAKTQTGEKLIEPGSISREDADAAASMISELSKQHDRVRSKTLRIATASKGVDKVVRIAGSFEGSVISMESEAFAAATSPIRTPWDFFTYLFDKAEEVAEWVLHKVGDVLQFVLTWAGKIYTFVCDTVAAIGKAITWVFQKIKVGIQKLIEFIGFLFQWDDILQFSDSIVTYINASSKYGEDQLDKLDDKVKTYVDNLRTQLKNRVQPNPPVTASTNTKDSKSTPDTDSTHQSVGYNWSTYQLKHGGFQKGAPTTVPSHTSDEQSTLNDIWKSFTDEVNVIKKLVSDIASTICALFDPNTNSTELFNKFTDEMIDALCDSLKNISDIFLKSLKLVIQKFIDLGNYKIDIPVFTALWKFITKGRDFTGFHLAALVMAIPASVVYKLFTKKPLPALANRLTVDAFEKFTTGNPSLDPTLAADIKTVRDVSALAGGFVLLEVTALVFAIDEIPGASGVTSKAISMSSRNQFRYLVDEKVGNIVDVGTLILTGFGLYFSWPLNYGNDTDLRWAAWGLDLSNGIFLAISRFIGWQFNIPRVETKRFVGVWELVTGIPIFVLEMIIAHHEYQRPEEDHDKTTRTVIEDVFQLVSCGGFCVAALADGVQPEVLAVGFAVFGLSLGLEYSFKFVDLVLEWTHKGKHLEVKEKED